MVADLYSILGDLYHEMDRDAEAYAAYDSCLTYQSDIDQLIKAAQSEDLYDNYKDEIEALQKKVNMDKATVLRAKKDEILPIVEEEIVTCYYFNRASVPIALRYDDQLRKAVAKWLEQE